MDPKSGGIPSVGCLLYVAADQLVAHRPSIAPFNMTRVPCKRVWVHSVHLSAMVLTATFLSLQESGHLSFRIYDESRRMPSYVLTRLTLYAEVLDPTLPPGLPGELLSAAIESPDGRVGTTVWSSAGLDGADHARVLGLSVEYPYVKYAVRRELAQVGAYTNSWRAQRPDCARITLLEAASADAVRWWKQQQADAPRLCALLLGLCRRASIPLPGPSDSRGRLFASTRPLPDAEFFLHTSQVADPFTSPQDHRPLGPTRPAALPVHPRRAPPLPRTGHPPAGRQQNWSGSALCSGSLGVDPGQ
jgi:hypothetical protein